MSPRLRLEALVLRRTSYGESDRIVTLLSREEGLVRAIAKHARASRRRFGGSLDLFARVQVELAARHGRRGGASAGEGLARLESAELLDAHLGLRQSLERLETASVACEAASLLVHEHEQVPELFDSLSALLAALAAGEMAGPPPLGRLWFLLRVLGAVGLSPMLTGCVRCGRRTEAFKTALFDSGEGGIVCDHCLPIAGRGALPVAGLRIFSNLAATSDPALLADVRVTPGGLETLWELGLAFFEHRAGRRLRSLQTPLAAPRD